MSRRANANLFTRRRMLVASSAALGAPLALAACGSEDELEARSEANDLDHLNAVLAQHLAVEEAASQLANAPKQAASAAKGLMDKRKESIGKLESAIGELDGEATDEPADPAEGESPTEALARQLETSIEASLAIVGDLSSAEDRQAVHRYITEDAAALAVMRSTLGEEVVPDAFVFGPAGTQEDDG